jgi:hypothetical protein
MRHKMNRIHFTDTQKNKLAHAVVFDHYNLSRKRHQSYYETQVMQTRYIFQRTSCCRLECIVFAYCSEVRQWRSHFYRIEVRYFFLIMSNEILVQKISYCQKPF